MGFLAIAKDLIKAFDLCDRYGTALPLFSLVGRFTGSCRCEEVGSRKPSVSRLVMIEAAGSLHPVLQYRHLLSCFVQHTFSSADQQS